jgi:putative acyl-CoA dehydrogenase
MLEVANQPPPLENVNLFTSDIVVREALSREHAAWAEMQLTELGARLGSAETIRAGFEANRYVPVLHRFDRTGAPLDEVEFHPSWHALLGLAVQAGLHSGPWAEPRRGAHVARAAGTYMLAQVESGVYCPVAMTYGSVPALRHAPAVAAEWLPRIFARTYDGRSRPASEKGSALIGMAMTENQGGSDLRANVTRATPLGDGGPRRAYALNGHKWFMSAPMCDAFLVLAQARAGPTCFLVPRWTPEGLRNPIRIRRLKDKAGNRSNASSEIELDGTYAELVGEEGRGIPTIIEMAGYTRLDCAIGSAGLMRQALAQAIHHALHRTAFQMRLVDHALMTNVLADMALECEAATRIVLRLARAYDEDDEVAQVFRRVVTPAVKFWICKRAPSLAVEAMEVLGGNGYVEDFILARIYREAPVNSIWEGSGNIMCLDVLRALGRSPQAAEIILDNLAESAAQEPRLGAVVARLANAMRRVSEEAHARVLARDLTLALQAGLLIRDGPPVVAQAFIASRLAAEPPAAFGSLPAGVDCRAIVDRAAPALDQAP